MRAVSSNLLRAASCFLLVVFSSNYAAEADVKYSNTEYGYFVLLPKSAARTESQAPAPQHGVAIDLPSGGRIWIDGSFDANFQGSAKAALRQLLVESGGKITRPLKQTKVANLEAASASYSKSKVSSTRVVAYRPRTQAVAIVYTFGLDTTRTKQREDNKLFESVVRSFSLTPMPE